MAFTYISTSGQLNDCITHLSQKSEIAIDLEFDKNRFRYGFNLCLMQIYSGDECFLVDPLSDELEIKLIFPILENPSIQKIAFSFGEDIRLLHLLGCKPKGIFDLSIASALLNYPPTSLTNLVMDVLSIDVGKSSQQSNWFDRPLNEAQLNYAANDVLFLLKLKDILSKKASENGIEDWIKQENVAFESANYENEDHNAFLKEKDKGDLTQFEWHLFSKLMEFREEKAEEMNKPSYHIIDKEYLKGVAQHPKRINDWQKIKSNHRRLKNGNIQNEVMDLLSKAMDEAEELKVSKTKKASNTFSNEEYKEFKQLQKRVEKAKKECFKSIQKAIESDLGKHTQTFILNNRLIKELVSGDTSNYLPYKKQLIDDYAEQLNLTLKYYIPN
ncbi:MAG: ribonuclease D [Balneolaceae bacterium]